ncbi:hypothetical protein [Flavobacterium aquicola]|uniref:PKD domain-containing protein n=1 Tax=Flavobacterium aquicola TaxID=1682742 RepID=A0A3E0EDV9_9FLAO|nr:hypothetical protein [Flavobacterium aquicola]REG96425.1 hypothetical protein C8P67_10970 [Flavobacterium aquicola]
MKKTKLLIASFLMSMVLLVSSCSPDTYSLDDTIDKSDISFDVTQDFVTNPGGNVIKLKNLTPDIIPYWSYTDSKGNEIGHSNLSETTISLPFAGTYNVSLTVFGQGGSVTSTKVITVEKNDTSLFNDPRWNLLTNGVNGKTWVLYMTAPLEFIGKPASYENIETNGHGWWPILSDISWAGLENKDWGEVTFDLDGGYNVSVKQTDPTIGSTVQQTKTGTFNLSLTEGSKNDRIGFNGGTEMLHPNEASYFSTSFSFTNVQIVELTETTLAIIAIRADKDYMIYHYVVK